MFYRGINPTDMGYAELKYYGGWHAIIEEQWQKATGS